MSGNSEVKCTRCYFAENTAFGIDVHGGASISVLSSEIVKNEQVRVIPDSA